MLTQQTLKEYLHYCPNTGIFTWIKSPINSIKINSLAGTISTDDYVVIRFDKKRYQAHRLVWLYLYGAFPITDIDHIDHDRSNNKLLNLRTATKQVNNKNASKRVDNNSGYTGVCWNKKDKRWAAYIRAGKVFTYLGNFKVLEDAVRVRKQAEIDYGYHSNHGK